MEKNIFIVVVSAINRRRNKMDYELYEDKNSVFPFCIVWLDDDGEQLGEEKFQTEEERQEAIDRWYADNDNFTPEQ
jgi:hypothetical protein